MAVLLLGLFVSVVWFGSPKTGGYRGAGTSILVAYLRVVPRSFGPLALQLWMSSGLRYVRAHLLAKGASGADKIYMDDRIFSALRGRLFLDKQDRWAKWSQSFGLVDSPRITQNFYTNVKSKRDLEALIPDILGCCVAFVPRKASVTELSRVAANKGTVRFLMCLRLAWSKYHLCSRYFAVGKALYGWVSRLPNLFGPWLGRFRIRATNRHLRVMTMGGIVNFDILAAIFFLRLVLGLRRRFAWPWNAAQGSLVYNLRK